jgi:HD-GYP domain-containing protein (c-di-GMP phosphodiesterase class II)
MISDLRFRYQHWMTALLVLLVIGLSAIFMAVIFQKFESMAREDASERFELIAEQAVAKVDALREGSARFISSLARGDASLFVKNGHADAHSVMPSLLAALDVESSAYGYYFGLPNDEFVQAIGVRKDPRIMAALQAPADTHYALRHIAVEGARRVERWRFLAQDRLLLGAREADASFAPTQRPWYTGARAAKGMVLTDPYLFSSTGTLGVTISQPLPDNTGVLAADLKLDSVVAFLADLKLPANSLIVLLRQGRIVTANARGERFARLQLAPASELATVKAPELAFLSQASQAAGVFSTITRIDGQDFLTTRHGAVSPSVATAFDVGIVAPVSEFTGKLVEARNQVLLVTLAILVVLIPLVLVGSARVSASLVRLAHQSERMKRLDFSERPQIQPSVVVEINSLGEAQAVMHDSIKLRTEELRVAQDKLSKIVENGLLMSREHNRKLLMRHILFGGRDIAHCAAGTLYLMTENRSLKFSTVTNEGELPDFEMPLYDKESGKPNDHFVSIYAAVHNETVLIDDVYAETRFDLSGTKAFSEKSGIRTVSMLTVPLSPGGGEVLGVLQYINALDPGSGEVVPFDPEIVGFVEALAAQSAVTLQNLLLLQAQKDLMDAMIKIIAGAIDAKSPYTGGHCERVPELAMMLAEEASRVDQGSLADFAFRTEDEWREFRIGAWLHDCGKVTTPEYVVDKATKLETIYNRIHEIRTRFEVLLRDADIERLRAIAAGEEEASANRRFDTLQGELTDEFAFIAETNQGGEFLAPERMARVRSIGTRTWMRHFDDRLGLSQDELKRHPDHGVVVLPTPEKLLADKPQHVVKRGLEHAIDPTDYHGFKITVPENLYNFGELHNLVIQRGTLNDEERFKINEHIVQTILMLENMPFPKNMRRIPEYAGTHHETLIGTGYPRRLSAEQMSVPSRIMAIADIFEALTASDRPYKKAKTLSESVKILSFFKKDKHIDAELFDLFLSSGVYARYAERYLKPEQIDEVDVARYLG